MIYVEVSDIVIRVSGHSGYAPRGQDIVCSAISTLVQTFIATMDNLYPDRIKYAVREREPLISICLEKDLNQDEKLLLKSFFIGIEGVASSYPEHVKIVRENTSKP